MSMIWSTKNKPFRDCSLWYRGCYAIGWAIEGLSGKRYFGQPPYNCHMHWCTDHQEQPANLHWTIGSLHMIRHDMTWKYMEYSGMVSAELEVGMPPDQPGQQPQAEWSGNASYPGQGVAKLLHPNCCISCALLSRPKQTRMNGQGPFGEIVLGLCVLIISNPSIFSAFGDNFIKHILKRVKTC